MGARYSQLTPYERGQIDLFPSTGDLGTRDSPADQSESPYSLSRDQAQQCRTRLCCRDCRAEGLGAADREESAPMESDPGDLRRDPSATQMGSLSGCHRRAMSTREDRDALGRGYLSVDLSGSSGGWYGVHVPALEASSAQGAEPCARSQRSDPEPGDDRRARCSCGSTRTYR